MIRNAVEAPYGRDRRNFQRRCTEYREDLAALGVLADLVDSDTPKPVATLKGITAALGRVEKWAPAWLYGMSPDSGQIEGLWATRNPKASVVQQDQFHKISRNHPDHRAAGR